MSHRARNIFKRCAIFYIIVIIWGHFVCKKSYAFSNNRSGTERS